MPIHIQIWTGSRSARVTDMTNASKRGKTCRVLRFSGCDLIASMPESHRGAELTDEMLGRLEGIDAGTDFDAVAELLNNAAQHARDCEVSEHWFRVCEDDPIRAIDAPKPKLEAGNDKWTGWADNEGIHLRDWTDRFNEPCACTFKQTASKAYSLASKVWGKVKEAETMHAASEVLREAGCKLHHWCAVD